MDPVVVISGGGIIGNYISSRLKLNSIQSIVVEKELRNIEYKQNIRTLTLNSFSKKLLDELNIEIKCAEIKKMKVLLKSRSKIFGNLWLIGTGYMGLEYAKVLIYLKKEFLVIGRNKVSAKKFQNEIKNR